MRYGPGKMMKQTIAWDSETRSILLINQAVLPEHYEIIRCSDVDQLATAIIRLEVRGAPALGVAGGFGVALAAIQSEMSSLPKFQTKVKNAAELLRSTRPTAINLAWGIDRVLSRVLAAPDPEDAKIAALAEAQAIAREDVELCHQIGEHGASLLPGSCTVLTHCNAGRLACVEWGTALGIIRSAVEMGKTIRVVACETRPLHQGSRLTAWELADDEIDVTVVTDSSAAHLMRTEEIDAVIVGADRICRDAVFNKIGTYMHAVCANHHNIPFYVAAPYSTFDLEVSEQDVVIEQRDRDELARCGGRKLIPDDVFVLNYAFDATPLDLVTAIITEQGILRPPFSFS
jgi:methylthioribose-1-phosphate isomerase